MKQLLPLLAILISGIAISQPISSMKEVTSTSDNSFLPILDNATGLNRKIKKINLFGGTTDLYLLRTANTYTANTSINNTGTFLLNPSSNYSLTIGGNSIENVTGSKFITVPTFSLTASSGVEIISPSINLTSNSNYDKGYGLIGENDIYLQQKTGAGAADYGVIAIQSLTPDLPILESPTLSLFLVNNAGIKLFTPGTFSITSTGATTIASASVAITGTSLKITNGAGANEILTSDASGFATWQPNSASSLTLTDILNNGNSAGTIAITNVGGLTFNLGSGDGFYFDDTPSLNGIIVDGQNTVGFKGLQYFSDYSANYNARSLIDSGYIAGRKLNHFASTSSGELAGVVSNETGSGTLVFSDQPVLSIPGIADLSSMQHDHLDADDGGTLTKAAISDLGTLTSGTYTATVTAILNCTVTATTIGQYSRNDSIVIVGLSPIIDPIITLTSTTFNVSIVFASDFTAVGDCNGAFANTSGDGGRITQDLTLNESFWSYLPSTASIQTVSGTFIYRIK